MATLPAFPHTQTHTPSLTLRKDRDNRIPCPVHHGKGRNVSVRCLDGRWYAKCWSVGCSSAEILAALGLDDPQPSPGFTEQSSRPSVGWNEFHARIPTDGIYTDDYLKLLGVAPKEPAPISPTTPEPTTQPTAPPLPPLTQRDAVRYLVDMDRIKAVVEYQRNDGAKAHHVRRPGKRISNPGLTGNGWQPRAWVPAEPRVANWLIAEGEKDGARLCVYGYRVCSAPGGASRLATADWEGLVDSSPEMPVILALDNDHAGRKAAIQLANVLKTAGLQVLDISGAGPEGGSIADLDPDDVHQLVHNALAARPIIDVRWLKPNRGQKQYEYMWCGQQFRYRMKLPDCEDWTLAMKPCHKNKCAECLAWERFLHWERAKRGKPTVLIQISGFGSADATIDDTVKAAAKYRSKLVKRRRDQKRRILPNGDGDNTLREKAPVFLSALTIGDDYRGQLAVLFQAAPDRAWLDRERGHAAQAGLIWQEHDVVTDDDIPNPARLAHTMEDGSRVNCWTSSGWPDWVELPDLYQSGREERLEDWEESPEIDARAHIRSLNQNWDRRLSVTENVKRREKFAEANTSWWVSNCLLDRELLLAAAAGERLEIPGYDGPKALLRDVGEYLLGRRPWRRCYGPVLAAAGIAP